MLNTVATHAQLARAEERTVTVPDALRGAGALVAQITAKRASAATLIETGTTTSALTQTVMAVGSSSPRTTTTTALLPIEDGQFTIISTAANSHVVITAIGAATLSADCLTFAGSPLLDSVAGIGGDGPLAAGERRAAPLVGPELLPDALQPSLLAISLTGTDVASSVELNAGDHALATYNVPPHRGVSALEVIAPTSDGTIAVTAKSGSVEVRVSLVAYATTAVTLNAGVWPLMSSTTATGRTIALPLPEKARDASTVFVSIEAQSSQARHASFRIWPAGVPWKGHTASSAVTAGGVLHQVVALPPGADGNVSVLVARATSWSANVVGWSSTPTPNAPADNVTVAAASDVVPDAANPNVVTYDGPTPLQPGDVLLTAPTDELPDGIASKVTSVVSAPNGSSLAVTDPGPQVLVTEPANIGDVLPDADFTETEAVDSGPPAAVEELPPLPPDEPPPNPDGTPALQSVTGANPQAGTSGGTGGSPRFQCSSGASASVSAGVRLTGDFTLSGGWGRWFLRDPHAEFSFTGGLSGDVRASISGKASCTGSRTFQGPSLPRLQFAVFGVPVWVTPQLTLDISINAGVESSVNASAGFDARFSAGIRWANGTFSPTRSSSLSFPSSLEARAGGSARIDVTPRLTFKVYSVAGPYVEVGAFAEMNVNLLSNPWWTIDAGATLGAGFVLDIGPAHLRYEAAKIDLFRRRFAAATGGYSGPAGGGGTPSGGTVGTPYDRVLTASGGQPPYRWYRVSGPLPPGITLRTDGHLVGTPTAAGTWTFVVRVIDAAGNRVASDQTVTVSFGNPPPPDRRSVTASKGASAQGRPGCTSSACRYLVVSYANFSAGTHTVTCNSTRDGEWYRYTTSTATTAYCYYGYPGVRVWATVDGVPSNVITW